LWEIQIDWARVYSYPENVLTIWHGTTNDDSLRAVDPLKEHEIIMIFHPLP
jgi:hypothetical protein